MKEQSIGSSGTPKVVTVLSVSPLEDDHRCLQAIVSHSRWKLLTARDNYEGFAVLGHYDVSVVLCERNSKPGTWIQFRDYLSNCNHPPSLVVTSGQADEQLWAQALNLGVWEVLAKPFHRYEVLRSVTAAWYRWHYQFDQPERCVARAAV
jgi:DNA-binding NtrC family response regulator